MFKAISFFLMVATTAANASVFDVLVYESGRGTVFRQTTTNNHCPKAIKLAPTAPRSDAKPGDQQIEMIGLDQAMFTHEGNSIYYRPGLQKNTDHFLDMSVSFPAGVAYAQTSQYESDGLLISKYTAVVASVAMVGYVHFKVEYDVAKNVIKYHVAGNGIDAIDCTYQE